MRGRWPPSVPGTLRWGACGSRAGGSMTGFVHDRWPVFHEDNHLLVVYKPAGLLSQGDASGADNLLDLCKSWLKTRHGKPGRVFLGLVHRLDRPVAGVMVFARTSKAAA